MTKESIDPKVYDLYDEYCHTQMTRRDFLNKASMLVVASGSALVMAEALFPRYAEAQTISFTDKRIKPRYVEYDSPGGSSGKMRGYLVTPASEGPFPAVLVIHENRGLNPYIEDVARRFAVEGFITLAPDGLAPIGGYPGNDDDGKVMQKSLDKDKLFTDMLNSAKFLKGHELSNGKLGATGFCYGGGVVNELAVTMGADLNAGVPFYGVAPVLENVAKIRAPLMLNYAEDDPRVNTTQKVYKEALKGNNKNFVMHTYEGTRHGFHNDSTPRYNEVQAELAWKRTISFFKEQLI
ncbi:dienelactone hydrolase-like enzyme [Desulfocapsa sulfexigens DSM 10523]|uniref:Dienelactone hydrolase-like enzyme n=1 Tax=Desulfocapsa sulfexigens (strain DSM 10523 / SB164P1) TaxID=1167006 RepID=M1NB75_DESSD|nr:dienelactone hydrolase family protein [Desulfocapsa sulfexigens]AGF77049.1 dienelactone hydrolase-like enzyme [Desulfocapsa sulfexigens DSM 10523]